MVQKYRKPSSTAWRKGLRTVSNQEVIYLTATVFENLEGGSFFNLKILAQQCFLKSDYKIIGYYFFGSRIRCFLIQLFVELGRIVKKLLGNLLQCGTGNLIRDHLHQKHSFRRIHWREEKNIYKYSTHTIVRSQAAYNISSQPSSNSFSQNPFR